MKQASFSVIITCFNQSAFIRETIESACNQTYPAKQIIVVDDASTDDSLTILEDYKDQISPISCRENVGASAARNAGATSAEGDYLVFLDGDDVLQPWALEVYSRIIDHKEPRVILAALLYFHGKTLHERSFYFKTATPVVNYDAVPTEIVLVDYKRLTDKDRTGRACASTIVVDRQAFEQVNGWTEALSAAEDYDLMLKLGACGRTIQIDSPPTVRYRIHEGNITHQVPRICLMLRRVLKRAASGLYRGSGRIDAFAFLGGAAFFWTKVALRRRCFAAALGLLYSGFLSIVVAAVFRAKVVITGTRPLEVLPGLCHENPSDQNHSHQCTW